MNTLTYSTIKATVGRGGKNNKHDVHCVQAGLNKHLKPPFRRLAEDGTCGPRTIAAIEEFQRSKVGLQSPDGRVDVGGRTYQALMTHPSTNAPSTITITGKKLERVPFTVLHEILESAGLSAAAVSSVERSPRDQARIMYENIVKLGIASQYKLYAAAGDKVIKVYELNAAKPKDDVIRLMEAKINEIGADKVSHHASTKYYVFDVPWASISNPNKFQEAVKKHSKVYKFINEPANKCFHIEVAKLG